MILLTIELSPTLNSLFKTDGFSILAIFFPSSLYRAKESFPFDASNSLTPITNVVKTLPLLS